MDRSGNNKKAEYISMAGLFLVAFIWGAAFVVVKNSLNFIPPVYMLAFRFTLAGGLMCAVLFKRIKKEAKENDGLIKHGVFLGLILFFAYMFQTIGCMYTTAGKNAFLTAVYVVIVPFLHWMRTKKMPEKLCFLAAVMALTGIGLISLNNDLSINIGDALTLVCGVIFAIHIEYLGKYSAKEDPVSLSALMLFTAGVSGWIFAPLTDGPITGVVLNRESVFGILFLGLFSSMLCFLLQSVCQKYVKASSAALVLSSEAVFGAFASSVFLNEKMSMKVVFGCIILFAAIILAQLEPSELSAKKGSRKGEINV